MSALILPRRLTRQPSYLPRLNYPGLVWAQVGRVSTSGPVELFNGASWLATPDPDGEGPSNEDYLDSYAKTPIGSIASLDRGTVFSLTYLRAPLGANLEYPRLFSQTNGSARRGIEFFLARDDSGLGGNSVGFQRLGTTSQVKYSVGGLTSLTGRNTFAATWDGATHASIAHYRNGIRLSTQSTSQADGSGLYLDSTQNEIGGLSILSRSLDGVVPMTLVFNRPLHADEIRAIHYNPQRVFSEPRLFFFAAGPTYTLSATAATFTTTGVAATLKASRLLAAQSGTFVVTGNAATLKASRKLVAGTAAFSTTGQAANLVYTPGTTYTLTASAASFVTTGNAANLLANRLLSCANGIYTSTFNSASLTYSGPVTLTPADIEAIAAAVWADPDAVAAHAKLDAILARVTC